MVVAKSKAAKPHSRSRNRGTTSLRTRKCRGNPLAEFDQLPPELRRWVSEAVLPWAAKSVRSAYDKALKRTGNSAQALKELDRLQTRLVAKDAFHVWSGTHPDAELANRR